MGSQKKHNNFLVQGSILALASIIVRFIGLIYRIPLTNIIGNKGNSYYSSAFSIYSIILMISSYSIPTGVSKMIASKIELKEYRNANRILKASLGYAVIVGGLGSLICFFAAPLLAPTRESILAIKVLAPSILFSAIIGVFRGFFQGHQTMIPTSISQVIEGIVNAIVSVGAALLLVKPYKALKDATKIGVYGAAGSTVGTGTGVVFGLIFILFIFLIYLPAWNKKVRKNKSGRVDSYKELVKILLLTITPILVSSCIYNISTYLENKLFFVFTGMRGYEASSLASMHGIYTGKFLLLTNLSVSFAAALAASMVPSITVAMENKDMNLVRHKIASTVKLVMIIAIPCSFGLAALGSPIMQLLFHDSSKIAQNLLLFGGFTGIFYCLSTVTNSALQAIDKMSVPVYHALTSVIIYCIISYPLLYTFNLKVYGLLIGMYIFSMVICVLNAISLRKYIDYKQEVIVTFIVPLIASVAMSICAFGTYKLAFILIRRNSIATICAFPVAIIIYFVLILVMGAITENELRKMPMGTKLVKVAKKCRLL